MSAASFDAIKNIVQTHQGIISTLITSSHFTFHSHKQPPVTVKISDSNLQTFPPFRNSREISCLSSLQDANGSNIAMVVVDTFPRPTKGAKTSSDDSSQATCWFSMFSEE